MFLDLISCYMTSQGRSREALACASEMCKKIHTCQSLTVSIMHFFSVYFYVVIIIVVYFCIL